MRTARMVISAMCAAVFLAGGAFAQRGPAGDRGALRLEKAVPDTVETSKDPVEVSLTGTGFVPKAVVRVRRSGDRGAGIDYPAVLNGPREARVRIPAEFFDRPGSIELRVKNPDGATSEWATIVVRAVSGPTGSDVGNRKPVVERVSPEQLEANSRSLHITVYGRDLADGAVATFRAGSTQAEAAGNLVNRALVVAVPDAMLARPQAIIMQIRNPGGGVSDQVRLEVVQPATPPPSGNPADPFITQVDPSRVDMRNTAHQQIQLLSRGADERGAKVLLRPEGSSESGKLIPIVDRTAATNGTVIVVEITKAMVADSGAYELRVVNPNGRQSNWVRFEVLNADPGIGNTGASVDARFPETVTLTAVTMRLPVELTVRNSGRSPVRLSEFAIVAPNGERMPFPGNVEVPAGEVRPVRLEAPAPLLASNGATTLRVALEYKMTLVSSRSPSFDGRAPEDGFVAISVRNEIALVDIGREYLQPETSSSAEGWRFFKQDNKANAGEGKSADFYLFEEPFTAKDALPTEALFNYRPDDSVPNDRGLFYLVLRPQEVSALDARSRERGTRLGYVATREAPGLVPLYRWELTDGRRTVNSFVTTTNEAAKLPRQMQGKRWKLDTVVGYVPARQP